MENTDLEQSLAHDKKHPLILIIAVIAAVLIILIFYYRSAVYMVYKNMTREYYDLKTSDDWENGDTYLEIPYASESENQYLDLYVPYTTGNKPELFVMIHGGGFITNDSRSRQAALMYGYFRDHGYACASINYRLAGEAAFPGAVSDCKAAIRFLRSNEKEYGYDASDIIVWGESAGGYLAAMMAVTGEEDFNDVRYIGQDEDEKAGTDISSAVACLVDYYGAVELSSKNNDWKTLRVPKFIVDIGNSWLHTEEMAGYSDVESYWMRKDVNLLTEDERNYSDPYYYAKKNLKDRDDLKVWIAHGDCDITVPILQSERFYAFTSDILGDSACHLEIIKDAGHAADIMYSDSELKKIEEFIR